MALRVGDLADSMKGAKAQFEAENGPYAKLGPDTGHAAIALQDRTQPADVLERLGAESAGHRAPAVLRVDDLDAAHAEPTSRGAEYGVRPRPNLRRVANFIEYRPSW